MAIKRDRPYSQFNFQVTIKSGGKTVASGGFEKVSGLVPKTKPTGKRDGKAAKKEIVKITGINKATDVTLKRGVVGNTGALEQWLNDVRSGGKKRWDVVVMAQSNNPVVPKLKWTLKRARIIKHTSGPLNAKSNDVAIETMVISGEGIDLS